MKKQHTESGIGATDAVLALTIGLAVLGTGAAVLYARQQDDAARGAGQWINTLGYASTVYARTHFDALYQAAGPNGLVLSSAQLQRDPDGAGPLTPLGNYAPGLTAVDKLGNGAQIVFRRGVAANQLQVLVVSDLAAGALPGARLGPVLEAPSARGFGIQKTVTGGYIIASLNGAQQGSLDLLATARQLQGVHLSAIQPDTRGYGYSAVVVKAPVLAMAQGPAATATATGTGTGTGTGTAGGGMAVTSVTLGRVGGGGLVTPPPPPPTPPPAPVYTVNYLGVTQFQTTDHAYFVLMSWNTAQFLADSYGRTAGEIFADLTAPYPQ